MDEPSAARPTPLFIGTLVVLVLVGGLACYWLMRKPAMGAADTTRAFLDAARAQDFNTARGYLTPDLSTAGIRNWMVGGFTYELSDPEDETPATADIEADIIKGAQHFAIRFSLYNGDGRWRINMMMVTR